MGKVYRFQIRRTKGWRKPPGSRCVTRSSRWGNPYRVEVFGRERAVELFRRDLLEQPWMAEDARRELRGRPLGCFCRLDQACHADVLLEVANAP
jgi:hypothetical protein